MPTPLFEHNTPRRTARGHIIVPFLELMHVTIRHLKVDKIETSVLTTFVRKLEIERLAGEQEIDQLFEFLSDEGEDPKCDLKPALRSKVEGGEIETLRQLEHFLKKARELADCLHLYLTKNEYNVDFMQEVSYDIFVNGFEPESKK